MGRYVINLSSRADDMTQEIILPVIFPDFTQRGVAHGEIRVTATLARPNGGVTLDLDVRGEDNAMVHHMRCVFQLTAGQFLPPDPHAPRPGARSARLAVVRPMVAHRHPTGGTDHEVERF